MNNTSPLNTPSEKIKKALVWLSEALEKQPEKSRRELLQQAEIRFDLCPADCAFLDKNFSGTPDKEH